MPDLSQVFVSDPSREFVDLKSLKPGRRSSGVLCLSSLLKKVLHPMSHDDPRSRPPLFEAVLVTLSRFSNPNGVCDMSLRDLSHVTQYSKRSVCRAVRGLAECQVLFVEHRQKADGTSLRNLYRLNTTGNAV